MFTITSQQHRNNLPVSQQSPTNNLLKEAISTLTGGFGVPISGVRRTVCVC